MALRVGFIGAGGIAHRHRGVLAGMPEVHITAVADPDRDRAAAFAPDVTAFADPLAMLEEEPLDALWICTPPFAHGPAKRAAIARRLPFFVEKPLAVDLPTAETVAALVAAAGLVTAVGYHWRYLDTVDEVRLLLAERPARLVSGYWLDQTPPPAWWSRQDRSGGQVVEQATHLLDLARHLVGEVEEVFAVGGHDARDQFAELDVATATSACLRFASGATGTLNATCLLRWTHRVGLHLFGDALAVELGEHELMVDVGRGRPVRHAVGDPFEREDRDFVDAVLGRPNRIRTPYAEALLSHRLALAVAESAATGRPVRPMVAGQR